MKEWVSDQRTTEKNATQTHEYRHKHADLESDMSQPELGRADGGRLCGYVKARGHRRQSKAEQDYTHEHEAKENNTE